MINGPVSQPRPAKPGGVGPSEAMAGGGRERTSNEPRNLALDACLAPDLRRGRANLAARPAYR
jgi:hypothetical protein